LAIKPISLVFTKAEAMDKAPVTQSNARLTASFSSDRTGID
jgi:hypothetical protein